MRVRFIWLLLLIGVLFEAVSGQNSVQIKNYDPDSYNDFRQNWSATQDSSGILFFGNSNGLLSFDGANWHQAKHAPKGNAVLTMAGYQNRIHWGGLGDLGVISPDSLGAYTPESYRSSLDSLYHDFSAVWQIFQHQGKLYHKTSAGLYTWEPDTVTFLPTDSSILHLTSINGRMIANIEGEGLSYYENDVFKNIPGSETYGDDAIFTSIKMDDRLLLVSREQGLVWFNGDKFIPMDSEANRYLKENSVYRGVKISDNEVALATLNGGILIINSQGDILNVIDEEDGLLTNTIYNLYQDRENSLWAATEFGIARLLIQNSFQQWSEVQGFEGSVLFIERLGNTVFVGTTEGLFSVDDTGRLNRYEQFKGRVYDGVFHPDGYLISTHDGIFQLQNGRFQRKFEERYLFFIEDPKDEYSMYGAGSEGVERLLIENGQLQSERIIQLDTELVHAFLDDDLIWILGLDKRVYQYTVDGELIARLKAPVTDEERVNRIGRIDDIIRLATNEGLFWYDELHRQFIPDSTFNDSEFLDEEIYRFQQCGNSEIWFRNNRMVKRAVRQNGEWRTSVDPYRRIAKNEGFETIYCDEDGSVWFGGSRHLYHLTDPDWSYEHEFNTNITGVLVRNDSLIYGGYGDPSELKELSFGENELRFTYAAASYIEPEANQYRTRLRGYEEEWSSWSDEPQKDYTFIPEGTYTFEVQGRNVYHKTGSIDSYTFTVLPPWYRTIWAYLAYLCLAGGVVYAGHKIRLNAILKEQRIRDGIARDLHDELSSTLSSISFFANAMDSPQLKKEKENRYLSLIKRSSREAKEKISDIVWVIHTENDDWENLLMRCKRFASDILDARDIQHSFEIKGSYTGKPTITQKKNIWLIFREILTNIARHAEPGQVHIRFNMNAGKLHIHIEDNGNGFDPENTREDGYGVQNIKERARQMKADCTLESMPGEGTRWVIDVAVG